MIHPHIDLDLISNELARLGFVQVTQLVFQRDFVEIEIKDGIITAGAEHLCEPFFRIKIYAPASGSYAQIDCDILKLLVFVNSAQ